MKLRACITSHFISSIEEGMAKKVHNTNSNGRPFVKSKKLKDIYEAADAMLQDGYGGTKFDGIGALNEATHMPFADRKTKAKNSNVFEEDQPESSSNEDEFDDLTLSQLKKKSRKNKRKASDSLVTPKTEYDDSDLSEPLFKFRVKAPKTSTKKMPVNESIPATVNFKVEPPEVDYFECTEGIYTDDAHLVYNGPATFIASESGVIYVNHELKGKDLESFTNEGEICGFNEASLNGLDEIMNMMLDNEENISSVNQSPSIVSSMEDDYPVEDLTASSSDCSQSKSVLEQVNHLSSVQDSVNTDVDLNSLHSDTLPVPSNVTPITQEQPSFASFNEESMSNVNQSPSVVSSAGDESPVEDLTTSTSDCSQSKSVLEQVNHLSSVHDSVSADMDLNSLKSDTIPLPSEDTPIIQEQPSFVSSNADSESNFSNYNYKTDIENEASDCIEPRHTERLPSTRKAISPTSQEKLCLAMKSPELLDDMDRYKCKEKLSFEEQPENKLSSTTSNIEYNEPNVHPLQAKAVITPKTMLKKPRSYKKGSPPQKRLPPKGCLDGPRLCRSLPRLSTGCTTVQGCSESAIAFSQRQMHDIESLASKLMTELNSMKVIVEEKLLFEAYRSTSLKNEADEVKSIIKRATKTEETSKKWLSMMARDCNRFCKIMKLTEDNEASSSADSGMGNMVEEKPPIQRERKKISFADEAGGMLCDIKVYELDQNSSELKQNPES